MTKVVITAENAPRMLANIQRIRAEMKALGMGRHGFFLPNGEIHWCGCKACLKARAQAVQP